MYIFKKINKQDIPIITTWKYPAPYNFYNIDDDLETISEFLNEPYYLIYNNKVLLGFCCFGSSAQIPFEKKLNLYDKTDFLDIGLGMKPSLTGQGYGSKFLEEVLKFAKTHYQPEGAQPSPFTSTFIVL